MPSPAVAGAIAPVAVAEPSTPKGDDHPEAAETPRDLTYSEDGRPLIVWELQRAGFVRRRMTESKRALLL